MIPNPAFPIAATWTPMLNPMEAIATACQSLSLLSAGYLILFNEQKDSLTERAARQLLGAIGPLLMLLAFQVASALVVAGDVTLGRILWYGPQFFSFIFVGRIFFILRKKVKCDG